MNQSHNDDNDYELKCEKTEQVYQTGFHIFLDQQDAEYWMARDEPKEQVVVKVFFSLVGAVGEGQITIEACNDRIGRIVVARTINLLAEVE